MRLAIASHDRLRREQRRAEALEREPLDVHSERPTTADPLIRLRLVERVGNEQP